MTIGELFVCQALSVRAHKLFFQHQVTQKGEIYLTAQLAVSYYRITVTKEQHKYAHHDRVKMYRRVYVLDDSDSCIGGVR